MNYGVDSVRYARLVEDCRRLVEIPSVSGDESAIADFVEARLHEAGIDGEIRRIGDNVVLHRRGNRGQLTVIAGHLDTVPLFGADVGLMTTEDRVYGLGATDMKAGLAVMLSLAELDELDGDLSLIFYVCEEVDLSRNGLRVVMNEIPELREADAAILMEPTSNYLEAGCQGTLRVRVELGGTRSHSARPWMGRNAIERLHALLTAVSTFERREPVIDGVQYRESLSAVRVDGGVANNVIPDAAQLWLNYRFAPDLTQEQACERLEQYLRDHGALEEADSVVVEDVAGGALPGLSSPVLAALRELSIEVRAKLGWTDVSYFAAQGIPAANFGPGDPLLAHSAGEWVSTAEMYSAYATLAKLLVASEE